MDWIDEKAERLSAYIRNLSFRKAMLAYISALAAVVWVLSYITVRYVKYQKISISGEACVFFYFFAGMIVTVFIFYHKRLRKPLLILEESVRKIQQNNLDFHVSYESRDELGSLCDSVEEMREELVRGKEEMWRLVERQKELNAAFAHDLRTPLTVLKGYTEFLARYIPEGKISEEKMQDTLKLMADYLRRLEDYSRTMKGVRSIEEVPFCPGEIEMKCIEKHIGDILFALGKAGGIPITYEGIKGDMTVFADDDMIMEVLENMLSNAIRYARSRIEVLADYDVDEKLLFLTVRDDGPGFSGTQLKRALLPYYKEDAENESGEHYGIGLHICRELCKKHGGTLSVANSIQGGAVVTASFYTGGQTTTNI